MFDIRRLEDININELNLKNQYYDNFINGDIDKAHQLIEDNPNLKFKVINAENLNKLIEYILNLENKYFNNVEDKLNNHLSNYQIDINDLMYLKNYDSKYQYKINNFVLYNNEIYYCFKNPPIGELPTNTLYWIYLGLKGEKSYTPLGVKYQGNWSSGKNYNKYDMIIYQNKIYVAKEDNYNENPTTSNKWEIQMQIEENKIKVSDSEPQEMKSGNIWFKIF